MKDLINTVRFYKIENMQAEIRNHKGRIRDCERSINEHKAQIEVKESILKVLKEPLSIDKAKSE